MCGGGDGKKYIVRVAGGKQNQLCVRERQDIDCAGVNGEKKLIVWRGTQGRTRNKLCGERAEIKIKINCVGGRRWQEIHCVGGGRKAKSIVRAGEAIY